MRKRYFACLLLACLGLLPFAGYAQPYGNEWIQFDQQYVKIKVAQEGIYRISMADLTAAGLPAGLEGTTFSLWRDGAEVPLFTSTSGVMAATDYVEFLGLPPNGRLDSFLYWQPGAQLNDQISLFTDTACYFLTFDPAGGHQRYTDGTLPIPGGLSPAPYLWAESRVNFKGSFIGGEYYQSNYGLYSAQFTKAEGYIHYYVSPPNPYALGLSTPGLYTDGPEALFQTTFLTQSASNNHQFKVAVNGHEVADTAFGKTETIHLSRSVSTADLAGYNTITYTPTTSGPPIDYYGVCWAELKYPRTFGMGGVNYFRFELPPSSADQLLEFTDFNHAGNIPRIYDLTNHKYYSGEIPAPGTARFYLPPSLSGRKLVIYSANTGNLFAGAPGPAFQFTNWQEAGRDGDYVIISHKQLETPVAGHNYVADYAAYRASAAGGGHTVARADVEELYDQFAYGYRFHPLSIRHFLKYAQDHWSTKPDYVFLIGRGILYYQYATYLTNPAYTFPVVPTYGHPGSDAELTNISGKPGKASFKTGRLSVWNATEVGNYLAKVKDYEQALRPAMVPTLATEGWKKQVLHIGGSVSGLCSALQTAAGIITDSLAGRTVYQVCKSTTSPVSDIDNATVDSLMNNGLSMITYYGHASSNTFEYNLNSPESYHNRPRVPFFLALGCDVAQMYELSTEKTMTERYILSNNGGAMVMIASDNTGYTNFLTPYLNTYYNAISKKDYGATLGHQYQTVYDSMMVYQAPGESAPKSQLPDSNFWLSQVETMLFTGDPAISLYGPDRPDYHLPAEGLATFPTVINNTTDSFRLRVVGHNLGRAGKDTVLVRVDHTNPAGTTNPIGTFYFHNLRHTDTGFIWLPVNDSTDVGLNTYTVTINADNRYEESALNNNTATIQVFIYSDDLVPVYPYDFSIVHQQPVTLKASTLNPFRGEGRYLLQLDTTEQFNSLGGAPMLQTVINGPGGIIKWQPSITLKDSTVYYWRTAVDSTVHGSIHWTGSSFIYLAGGSDGWNQSHYYQWRKNNFNHLDYDSTRTFRFREKTNKLEVRNILINDAGDVPQTVIYYNESQVHMSGQSNAGGFQVMVIDSTSGTPWINDNAPNYNGALPPDPGQGILLKEFVLTTQEGRLAAAHFLRDSVPAGNYVMLRNFQVSWLFPFSNVLETIKADSLADPDGYSLYKACKDVGFSAIDSFYFNRIFIYFGKKGDPSYPASQLFNDGTHDDVLTGLFYFKSFADSGQMISTTVGPAKTWTSLHWKTIAQDGNPAHDQSQLSVYGIQPNGSETFLFRTLNRDTLLSGISTLSYPRLRLTWHDRDSVTRYSPQQLFWRVLYTPVPEAALNPAAYLAITDSAAAGQDVSFGIAIENLSDIPMDSLLVRYRVINAGNSTVNLPAKRYRPLPANDTLHATVTFSSAPFAGSNYLFVEANPDNDQPEQYHPNNLGYVPFKAGKDELNPLLDVTFDGIHILNRDIVSAKPFIKVLLRDENKYLRLDDTSLATVELRYPDASLMDYQRIPFDNNVLKFIPASGSQNEAYLEFRPRQLQDGIYSLRVNAKDKSGNTAAKGSYEIEFEVINKSTVTQVLNYPNPFSTATAFVFTLTGSELPTQFKIQILTVSGKVVREITRQELGPLHIGRNITEYKWDGRDQYGQLLGNGVYMYRVVTAINGQSIEQRNSGADKYFKNGWGKLYIMR